MLLFETEHILDLLVAQRCFPLTHLPGDLGACLILLQELRCRHSRRDSVISGIEDLEA